MASRFSVPATTDHGMLVYHREGDGVVLKLNYRDPEASAPLPEATPAALTRAIDALRDEAIARMRGILEQLLEQLLADPRMPEDDREDGEFVDPTFTESLLLATGTRQGDRVTVTLPPFYAEISDPEAGESPDRFLAGEYVRAVIRHRAQQLWAEFEHARRNLVEDLWYPPQDRREM